MSTPTAYSTSLSTQNEVALDLFFKLEISGDAISYLAAKALQVITYNPQPQTHDTNEPAIPSLETFIKSIVEKSKKDEEKSKENEEKEGFKGWKLRMPTFMASLVYLQRLKEKRPGLTTRSPWTIHGLVLTSLIVAEKFLEDGPPTETGTYWTSCATVKGDGCPLFLPKTFSGMEWNFLRLLDWHLMITREDLYYHFEPFLAPKQTGAQKGVFPFDQL